MGGYPAVPGDMSVDQVAEWVHCASARVGNATEEAYEAPVGAARDVCAI